MKSVAAIIFVLFCFLCMADHQMGGIKLAEANSSRMPLMFSTKHASLAPAPDLATGSVTKTRFAAIATVAKFHPSAYSPAIGGTD
ncbi:hypothetical protein C1H46_021846 [Malus baccata]|uniref:BURP domain-containing protein n=1 Tax=Malus baccata TaxID=106549 RepID=A0A540M1I0_MALBA|nr:hypothetical protein C1H46_021845 [Malus baccata]TQD92594.1 hypothetical protein C1H46_021846 [Malus baccata]